MTPAELKAWREGRGLSQPALARALGVDHMTISRWERGRHQIPPFLTLALQQIEQEATR